MFVTKTRALHSLRRRVGHLLTKARNCLAERKTWAYLSQLLEADHLLPKLLVLGHTTPHRKQRIGNCRFELELLSRDLLQPGS